VVTQSIEYRSVGIKLNVIPKINEEKFVTLDVSQELSEVNEARAGLFAQANISAIPLIRRQARTSVIVRDQETLVIGGLIRKTKSDANNGAPFLSRVPVFGWLFGSQSKSDENTELLIFITPHVVTDIKEARSLTEEFESRLKQLQISVKQKKS
jgi:general secretion pathway protein D